MGRIRILLYTHACNSLMTAGSGSRIRDAVSILDLIQVRKLPTSIVAKAIEHAVKTIPNCSFELGLIAEYGSPQAKIDRLFLDGRIHYETAIGLGVSKEVKEEMLARYISKGKICQPIDDLLKSLNRELSVEEIITLRTVLSDLK